MAKRKQRKRRGTAGIRSMPSAKTTVLNLIRSEGVRFSAKFGLSCLGLQALFCMLPVSFAKAVCEHTARTLGHVLDAFGFSVNVAGNVVSDGGLTFLIVLECTALFSVALFACFVSFYHAEPRKKAAGLVMGIPALFLGNLARLVLVFVVSRHNPRLFNIVHVYLGQVFTMLLVVISCMVWLRWVNRDPVSGPAGKAAGFFLRFLLISGCMFLFWMEVQHWYIWLIDRFMVLGFSLFGWRIIIPKDTAVYYETFSLVTFASLILATRSVEWSRKAKWLAAGMSVFFLLHLFHRINNALMSAFHFTSLFRLDLFLCDIGQYLLPVLFWLALAVQKLSRRNTPSGHSRAPLLLP